MKTKLIGTVKRAANDKTVRCDVDRLVAHPMYGKTVKERTVCYVHDENNEAAVGDLIEIIECRPRSKSKRWELVRIVRKAPILDA